LRIAAFHRQKTGLMESSSHQERRIAVLVPCYNEASTIAAEGELAGFREAVPGAEIHVFDNASTDGTGQVARKAGAGRHAFPRCRGRAMLSGTCSMLSRADRYIMVDGDSTYPPEAAGTLLASC